MTGDSLRDSIIAGAWDEGECEKRTDASASPRPTLNPVKRIPRLLVLPAHRETGPRICEHAKAGHLRMAWRLNFELYLKNEKGDQTFCTNFAQHSHGLLHRASLHRPITQYAVPEKHRTLEKSKPRLKHLHHTPNVQRRRAHARRDLVRARNAGRMGGKASVQYAEPRPRTWGRTERKR